MQFYHPGKKCGNFYLVCKKDGSIFEAKTKALISNGTADFRFCFCIFKNLVSTMWLISLYIMYGGMRNAKSSWDQVCCQPTHIAFIWLNFQFIISFC